MTFALVFVAGFAALSWEAIWQIEASLSIGVSALGTAITLASTMAGMAAGALLMGRFLRARTIARPLALYGALELVIGLSGVVLLAPGFAVIEHLDGAHYLAHPALIPLVHLAAIVLLLAPQTIAMGATIPLFGCIARAEDRSLSTLYASNTAGATLGVFTITFGLLPYLGVEVTGFAIACANLAVAAVAQLHRPRGASPPAISAPAPRGEDSASSLSVPARQALLVAFSTGLVSFGLEVAWFRSLRAAFWSTTQSFGVLLISVLLPLALGARLARSTHRRRIPLGALLATAAILALLATPWIERSDRFLSGRMLPFWPTVLLWTVCALATIGPSMAVLGTCLPRLFDEARTPGTWGRLYAANTAGSVLGSLGAGWLALPHLGFARTVWLFAGGLLALGVALGRGRVRLISMGVGVVSLALAVAGESGLGRTRVSTVLTERIVRIVDFREGPDSTYAVIDNEHGARLLMIDGFVATGEIAAGHYMPWMGHLPMILHPAPERALVICFGTGQTANAVRWENPRHLDVVELSEAVLAMAPHFASNHDVLHDPRVRAIVMDGRAWLRRTTDAYDVVTLEPMPPNFAGVNALYSREFYALVAQRLAPGGIVAQWVPFHILSLHDAIAIAATFREAFPDAILWFDSIGKTGILVGRRRDAGSPPLGQEWPGLSRAATGRDLDAAAIPTWVALDPKRLETYTLGGAIITDDNQLLAYGPKRHRLQQTSAAVLQTNLAHLAEAAMGR